MIDLPSRSAVISPPWLLWFLSVPLFWSACGRTPLLPPRCSLVVEPASLDFGEVEPFSQATRTLAVSNRGAVACHISNLGLDATSAPDFALGSGAAMVVEPEQRATIEISFQPTDIWPPLERSGTLVLQTNDPMRRHLRVPLAGRVLSTCTFAITPAGVDFGHVALDDSASSSIQVANIGIGPCAVAGLGFAAGSDAQFMLAPAQETSFMLQPGEQRDIPVSFHATDASAPHHRSALLVFQISDTQNPTASIPLSADIDIGCSLTLSPASVDFGNVILNASATASVTLGNDGSSACQVSGIALATGTDSGFSLDPAQARALTVEPGTEQTVSIAFDAFDSTLPRLKTGTLVLQTGNPRAPDASVPLSAYVNSVCVEASRWIYTVDTSGMLSKFDPSTLKFTEIAMLTCSRSPGSFASPNSMAVDQNAVAWVGYSDGNLYKVDTSNGKCEPTTFAVDQHGLYVFGMGFVFDPSTGIDTLYIAGGAYVGASMVTLATVSFPSLVATPVGSVSAGFPELSGTGDGALWGFIPGDVSSTAQATLVRLDPTNGKMLESFQYPSITESGSWAMKFWGGSFWIFLNNSVYQVTRDAMTDVKRVIDYRNGSVVGAGVSTCAPVQQP
jgi:hypothetical protein